MNNKHGHDGKGRSTGLGKAGAVATVHGGRIEVGRQSSMFNEIAFCLTRGDRHGEGVSEQVHDTPD
jgi:hypothetical protein